MHPLCVAPEPRKVLKKHFEGQRISPLLYIVRVPEHLADSQGSQLPIQHSQLGLEVLFTANYIMPTSEES